ncbi:MAG: polysaccharide biosynthesis tyrosine autokinase [Lentisphaeria bacterium]|nr:polysaccharide biosynthesis tyrosine autokinase [Lentisphaeria bacterium]
MDQPSQIPAQIVLQMGPDPSASPENEGAGIDLSVVFDYLDMVRSRLWLAISVPVLLLAIAFGYLHYATPVYQSSCQLQIQLKPLRISGMESVYDPMSGPSWDRTDSINTEIELMQTPEVLNRAFEELNLASDPDFMVGNPVGILAGGLSISQKRKTYLIDVAYRSTDPEKAARIANALGDLYVRNYQDRKREVAGGGMDKLQDQLESLAKARDEAQKALSAFKAQHEVMDLDYERQLRSERISALTETLIAAEMEERAAKDTVETIGEWSRQGHVGAVVEMLGNPLASTFRQEQLRMQMDLPELLRTYGREHSKVQTQEAIIANLEKAIADEIESSLVGLRLKAERAARSRQVVTDAIKAIEAELMGLDAISSDYSRLKDTYSAAETAYRKVIARLNDVEISAGTDDLEANDFLRIVRRAVPNLAPVSPRRQRTLALALVLGLGLGAGGCVFLGLLDTSVKNQDEVTRCFGDTVVLGSLPRVTENEGELVAIEKPLSLMAEAFRGIRTNLSLCLAGRSERCFGVTSTEPGEGKTTVALNLAIALAREKRRVLLLECDMRRPRLKHILGEDLPVDPAKGVSTVLVGDDELREVVGQLEAMPNLDIAICGPVPPNPAELMGTDRFREVLEEARKSYDYVILDSPPLLHVADAAILAGAGVPLLFVVRLFRTTRHDLRLARERLQTIQAKCAGILINNADVPKRSRYGYYRYGRYYHYRKGYGYGYGYGERERKQAAE